ncbi:hypothetical protein U1Q18_000263, partial [Sarracenia purpurea var. burkii]
HGFGISRARFRTPSVAPPQPGDAARRLRHCASRPSFVACPCAPHNRPLLQHILPAGLLNSRHRLSIAEPLCSDLGFLIYAGEDSRESPTVSFSPPCQPPRELSPTSASRAQAPTASPASSAPSRAPRMPSTRRPAGFAPPPAISVPPRRRRTPASNRPWNFRVGSSSPVLLQLRPLPLCKP